LVTVTNAAICVTSTFRALKYPNLSVVVVTVPTLTTALVTGFSLSSVTKPETSADVTLVVKFGTIASGTNPCLLTSFWQDEKKKEKMITAIDAKNIRPTLAGCRHDMGDNFSVLKNINCTSP